MSDTDDSWPPYFSGTRDHMHAIGVLTAAWTEIELAYQVFLQLIFASSMEAGIHVHELLTNEARAKLIRAQLIPRVLPEEAEHIEYFLKCANICKDNRNAIAHAQFHRAVEEGSIRFSKGSARDRNRAKQFLFTVDDIREMADACYLTQDYGFAIWGYINLKQTKQALPLDPFWTKVPNALPQKPAQPRNWDQIREDPTLRPPPPGSSGE